MKRTLVIAGAAMVVLGGGVAAALVTGGSGREPRPAKLPPATTKIVRTTLVDTKTVPGTLGYGDPVPLSTTASGVLTWIAPVGSTVERGKPFFKIDERPVVALYGSLPLYRTLAVGTIGADVRELEQNLAALGYTGVIVDDTYTPATADVVRRWQTALGLAATGTVEPDQVAVMPGAVRIAEDTVRVGDSIGGGSREGGTSVLRYTGTTRLVTVALEVAERALAVQGRTVTVTVPGAGTVQGTIADVGTVATANEQAGGGPGTTTPASAARIRVTITIADQQALGALDAAPVDVDLVSDERKDVLAVPVTALLALADGGYGVQVVDGATTRILAVKTGVFAAGRVEVSGNGITEGVVVGVAK